MIPLYSVSGAEQEPAPRNIGRYLLFREIGHGGMATVHLGRLHGPAGFARTVAIKKLHTQYARDPEFVSMFLDEARLAARIQHPNVVSVLDVVAFEGELFLIMDYVHGESLFKLFRSAAKTKTPIPRRIFVSIITSVLYGLDAAHDARSDLGTPLEIVHRDVSPQNVLLGIDGIVRLLDFGVAKATQRVHWSTQDGKLKGKLSYMAPEQISTGIVDRRADVYAAGVMLWEGLTSERLHKPDEVGLLIAKILSGEIKAPSTVAPSTPKVLDAITLKALARSPADRYETAREMATALERAIAPATPRQIGEWVARVAGAELRERAETLAKIEGRAAPEGRHSDFRLPAARPNTASSAPLTRPDERKLPSLADDSLTPTEQIPEGGNLDIHVELEGPSSKSKVDAESAGGAKDVAKEDLAIAKLAPISQVSASELLPMVPEESSSPSEVAAPKAAADVSDDALPVPGVSSSRKKTTVTLTLGAVFIAGLVLGGRACAQKAQAPALTTSAVAASTASAPLAAVDSLPPIPRVAAPFIATAVATKETPAPDTATTKPAAPITKPVATAHPTTRKNTNSCDPPYTIDPSGVRVPKRQCL